MPFMENWIGNDTWCIRGFNIQTFLVCFRLISQYVKILGVGSEAYTLIPLNNTRSWLLKPSMAKAYFYLANISGSENVCGMYDSIKYSEIGLIFFFFLSW